MKIIVTGGAGFVGSALARYLISDTCAEVTVVDSLTYAATLTSLAPVYASPRFQLIHQDIRDFDAMCEIFASQQPDTIMHLAAESHVDRSILGARAFVESNVIGSFNLLEAARGYWTALPDERADRFRFLHVSSDEVYGSLGADGLFKETTAYDPSSPYSASKAASDHLVMAWHRTYGMPTLISNCSNNYGPYHFPEKLIPLLILNALEGKPLPIYGDGSNIRDWLFVEDHVRALVKIATEGRLGEKYNVGGRNERTNLTVAETVCDILDEFRPPSAPHRRLITYVQDRPGHDRRYAIDATKLESELGWRAQETFETGIRKTVQWYLDNEAWWAPLRRKVYTGERLGLINAGKHG